MTNEGWDDEEGLNMDPIIYQNDNNNYNIRD